MNATGTPAKLLDRPARSALDLPVAGLAALAVAFAAFTVPDALLSRAVEATGLPELLTAARPPLGNTARLSIAAAGAVIAFVAAFALLGWLERFGGRTPARLQSETEPDAPRINKADAHPDAPPRRPISAARDLGEPAPPSRPRASEAPAFSEAGLLPPVAEPASRVASAPVFEGPPSRVSPRAVPPELPVARRVEQPAPSSAPSSLGDLMARLELGLIRREQQAQAPVPEASATVPPPAPAPVTAPAPEMAAAAGVAAPTPPLDAPTPRTPSSDRLQMAIDGLRALSV